MKRIRRWILIVKLIPAFYRIWRLTPEQRKLYSELLRRMSEHLDRMQAGNAEPMDELFADLKRRGLL